MEYDPILIRRKSYWSHQFGFLVSLVYIYILYYTFSDCAVKEEAKQAQNDEVAARLWTFSEEMVGWKSKQWTHRELGVNDSALDIIYYAYLYVSWKLVSFTCIQYICSKLLQSRNTEHIYKLKHNYWQKLKTLGQRRKCLLWALSTIATF